MTKQTILMDSDAISAALDQMSQEILKTIEVPERAALIGVRTAGVYLANRLQFAMEGALGLPLRIGSLDITLYRDDLCSGLEKLRFGPTDITFDISGQDIILVDDILFTGRTVRAALDELMDLGRPRRISLAVLLDRGHRELPIEAGVVGRFVRTTKHQAVKVHLREDPRYLSDQVVLLEDLADGNEHG